MQLSPTLEKGSQFLGVCFMSVGMLAFIALPLTGAQPPRLLGSPLLRWAAAAPAGAPPLG